MINVAFTTPQTSDWIGGVNYHKNLLYAISTLERKKINPVMFLGKETPQEIVNQFTPYAEVVIDSYFDRSGLKFMLYNKFAYHFNRPVFQNRIFKKYKIDIVHQIFSPAKGLKFKTVSWIPDFQHVHLPSSFSQQEVHNRNKGIQSGLDLSDAIIVSSNDAYTDCIEHFNVAAKKMHVLQFVSQPGFQEFKSLQLSPDIAVTLPKKYFYLPNQFWQHKNHFAVFEAVNILKKKGLDIELMCSGSFSDYRNPEYITKLKTYINDNDLSENIRLLGLIDYKDVIFLIRHAHSVINPSRFEGWSSTVEECKSIGKSMILSDIPVHLEQNPNNSVFFSLDQPTELAKTLKSVWLTDRKTPEVELENNAAKLLPERTQKFAECFQNIIDSLIE